jgi:hypothetical protein
MMAFAVVSIAVLAGNAWLGSRFKKYKTNLIPCLEFASEKDRRIAFWQKFRVIMLCGLVAPWLGIAVNYLIR